MGRQLDALTPKLQEFIKKQKLFFVGTAAAKGRVNISPKGMDTFRVLSNSKIIWLNLTGSGNETAAHLLKNNRMTIMFCAFQDEPLILRLYGSATIYHERDNQFQDYKTYFSEYVGARQIIEMNIEMVQTSCGFAVPLMDYKEDRILLNTWAEKKGKEKLKDYWKTKNTKSIDGFETNIF